MLAGSSPSTNTSAHQEPCAEHADHVDTVLAERKRETALGGQSGLLEEVTVSKKVSA